jgi:hypothetical protein
MKKAALILALLMTAALFVQAGDDDKVNPSPSQFAGAKVATPPNGIEAKWDGHHLALSDGRNFHIHKVPAADNTTQLAMSIPAEAQVIIEYADGTNTFTSKVPFVYTVPAEKSNENFKLTVNEGSPEKTWSINLQHQSSFVMSFSPASH